jgi:hypothetical protein
MLIAQTLATANLSADFLCLACVVVKVAVLAVVQDFSPRLVFHVVRSYILLCQHPRYVCAHNLHIKRL